MNKRPPKKQQDYVDDANATLVKPDCKIEMRKSKELCQPMIGLLIFILLDGRREKGAPSYGVGQPVSYHINF